MYTVETIKYGRTGTGAYDTPDQTIGVNSFDTKKDAQKFLRDSLKNGYQKFYGNYVNYDMGTELHTNF
ncbi:hypothetical protein K1F50_01620 [Muricauda oceani]|uniref:Uncharacterized protein n=1 Tax=Flagellimonas oceani TaxID=2698672 RepID=A0A6G7J1U1_9FLAO|nr:hypothetical protein [Allomuricauda oceani]MBW8241480.1 hypothetical protein [Allomuricauda oceani]QII44524.1 hypothetical protein GVT53_07490 [Allomuricauda oceani]